MDHTNITTALELPGVKINKNVGLVKGITVRSRSIVETLATSLQTSPLGTSPYFPPFANTLEGKLMN